MKEATGFSSWRAFSKFEKEVCRNRRYIRTPEAERFLDAVRGTLHLRTTNISEGRGFWRAQAGHDWRRIAEFDAEVPCAFRPDRMKPLRDRAIEGRANPKGIPMLYLCSNKDAAMSEVRPWIGSLISLGHFFTTKKLKLVDCRRNFTSPQEIYLEEPPAGDWTNVVWSEINRAFTKPVTRNDDTGEYVATQILVELFQDADFDGVSYSSAFGEQSTNLALFDLDCATLNECQLHEVTQVKMNFRERDNPYWVKQPRSKSQKGG